MSIFMSFFLVLFILLGLIICKFPLIKALFGMAVF